MSWTEEKIAKLKELWGNKQYTASQIAEILGGINALKALKGPFPKCEFFPTGGINEDNILDYLSLDNVCGVAGSWLFPRELIKERNWLQIRTLLEMSKWNLSND